MADMREVHADLVRAPRLQFACDKRRDRLADLVVIAHLDLVVRNGTPPDLRAHDRDFRPVRRAAGECRINAALHVRQRTPNQTTVATGQPTVLAMDCELLGEALVSGVTLRDHQQPGRILVEAMYNAWPPDAADAGKTVAAVRQQRIHESSRRMPCRRMHHEARRLVDDDEMAVLEHDIERDILRLGRRRDWRW